MTWDYGRVNDDNDAVALPINGTLDLHAFAPSDVKELVADYIDACIERGIYEVRIIHGKGTGNLHRIVHSVLERHERVASFRLAGEEQGPRWTGPNRPCVDRVKPAANVFLSGLGACPAANLVECLSRQAHRLGDGALGRSFSLRGEPSRQRAIRPRGAPPGDGAAAPLLRGDSFCK